MAGDIILNSLLFIVLLFLSAFFSASEVALFSLQQSALEEMQLRKPRGWQFVIRLLESPRKLLISILIGNAIVNTLAAIVMALLTLRIAEQFQWDTTIVFTIEVIVVTFVMIVLSEVTPKVIAANAPVQISCRVATPLYAVSLLLYPFTLFFAGTMKMLEKMLGLQQTKTALMGEDIKTLVDVGSEEGTIDSEERNIIHSLIDSKESIVRDVMTPRARMVAVECTRTTLKEVVELFRTQHHSRIPVYDESIDFICGVLYAKDILPLVYAKHNNNFTVRTSMRQPLFVPETKKNIALLKELQEKKTHIAIVIDEYGGTAGMVTYQDLMSEIVGEVHT